MGWCFGIDIGKATKTEIDGWYKRSLCDRYTQTDGTLAGSGKRKVYFAIYYDTKDKVYDIEALLIENWEGEWGYKPIGRPIGYFGTPESLMRKIAKLNPEIEKDKDWAEWCDKYWANKKKSKEKKQALADGATIKFNDAEYNGHDTFIVHTRGNKTRFETLDTHETFRLLGWTKLDYEIIKEA